MATMLMILALRWMTNGWRPMEADDSELMATAFIAELTRHGVRYEHYLELYQRAVDYRVARLADGETPPDFSVELMLAQWPGLKRKLGIGVITARQIVAEMKADEERWIQEALTHEN